MRCKINVFTGKKFIFLTLFPALLFFSSLLQAQETHVEEVTTVSHTKKFNPGEMITEHIGDGYGWHLWGTGHEATSIPLPIILYNKERGLSIFSSSRFHHGDMTYAGYKLTHHGIVAVNEMDELRAEEATVNDELSKASWDFSITKNVAALLISCALLLWIFLSVAKAYKKNPGGVPRGLQSFMEPLIMFIRDDVAKASIGPKYEKFMPYLLTVFFFIFLNNLLGLVPIFPGGSNLTGNIAVCLVLAALTLVITLINGNGHYWRHIFAMPGVPIPVLIILTPIELIGVVLRPFVLMIRLFANITAGHIIALAFFSLIFIFGEKNTGAGLGVSVVSIAFTVFMGLMELLVAFLQAYVFTLLSAIYFGSAVEEGHHHADEHAHH